MLRFRRDEKLLDALLGLTKIFGLVRYMEHVPHALLNSSHGRTRLRQRRTFRFLCSLLHTPSRHSRSAVAKCIKQCHATSSQMPLLTDFGSFPFGVHVTVDLIGIARAITRLDALEAEIDAVQKTEASKTRS